MTNEQAAPINVLLIGRFDDLPPALQAVSETGRFDAVFCAGPARLDREALITLRAVARQPLFPVFWFGPDAPGFADARFPDGGPASLREASAQLHAMMERIGALPQAINAMERDGWQFLAYLHSRQCDARPAWAGDLRGGVDYPAIRPDLISRSLLSSLFRAGLLERDYWRASFQCGGCGSARLNVAEHCVSCKSTELTAMDIVHHFPCGHQGPQGDFQILPGGRMVCPSCEQALRHFGVDYDKPGHIRQCDACRTVMEEPDVFFECRDCGELTASDSAPQRRWYHYRLSPQGIEAVLTGHMPDQGLLGSVGDFEPAKDRETFVLLLENGMITAQRYNRPFSICSMRLRRQAGDARPVLNSSNDAQTPLGDAVAGSPSHASIKMLLREILRDSDFLLAQGDRIVFAFPETTPAELSRIVTRIDAGLRQVLVVMPVLEFENWSDFTLEQVVGKIRDVH